MSKQLWLLTFIFFNNNMVKTKDLLEYLSSMEAFVDEDADPDRVVHISVTTKDGKRLRGRLCRVARMTHGGVLNLYLSITEDKEAEK